MKKYLKKIKQRKVKFQNKWSVFRDNFYLREKTLIVFLLLILFLPMFFLTGNLFKYFLKEMPQEGGSYTEGLVGSPTTLNPLFASSSLTDRTITSLIYSGLTKKDDNGKISPDLAENWQISEDKKNYIFNLKKNINWHDGQELLSGDVLYTYSLTQDPDYFGPLRDKFKNVKISLKNEHTVVFDLPEPDDDFLKKTTLGILPLSLWSQFLVLDIPYANLNLNPVGSGPFKLRDTLTDEDGKIESIILDRNESFYSDKPFLANISFKFYPDKDSIYQALVKKELDASGDISHHQFSELKDIDRFRVYSYQLPSYKALFFNHNKNELLKEKEIRQLIDLAINKDQLITENLKNSGVLLDGFFPAGKDKKTFNQEDLDKLLIELSLTDENKDQIKEYKNQELKLDISILSESEEKEVARKIKKDLEKVGFKINIKEYGHDEFEKDIIKLRDYEVILFGQSYGEENFVYPFWHSSQFKKDGLKLSSISSKRVDALLDNYQEESNQQKKEAILITVSKILNDDKYAVFLYQPLYNFVTDKRIKGFKKYKLTYPEEKFINIQSWYVKTKITLF